MEFVIMYGAGTIDELKSGVILFHYPTKEDAVADLAEYKRLSKKHGEKVTEETEEHFSVIRGGILNTYKVAVDRVRKRKKQ